jgi:leucyl aminopeptidase
MPTNETASATAATSVLAPADSKDRSVPIWIVRDAAGLREAPLTDAQRAWTEAAGFKGSGNKHLLIPGSDGTLAGVALGIGDARDPHGDPHGDPMSKPEILLGLLPGVLPHGLYHIASGVEDGELAATAWGLGAYRFRRYKAGHGDGGAQLKLPPGADLARVQATVDGVWLGRDLINTPAGDLGPQELEDAARQLAKRHGASVASVVGEDLLAKNLPMIHAVGRASQRAPRLIDLAWGRPSAPSVTLVGKGICFDTGGLDLKPASAMLLMKKDMGGAATALALAHIVMANALDVRLRVLIPAAENSVAGNAYRPGDVLTSRAGKTVEIGNTDAEGRLVLADALALADEERPDTLVSFATLTGAARTALGPELPPLYTDDDAFAGAIAAAGLRVGDPVWRMPFWSSYESTLDSPVADMNNVSEGPFAGSVTAALFLRRFVKQARRFAHFDIYGWRQAAKPLGPKGAEVQAARAVIEVLRAERRG